MRPVAGEGGGEGAHKEARQALYELVGGRRGSL